MVYFAETDITSNNKTSFGEIAIAQRSPACLLRFDYDTISPDIKTGGTGTYTITIADNQLQMTTTNASKVACESKKRAVYLPGCGIIMRCTARITTTSTTSTGYWGIGDIGQVDPFSLIDGYVFARVNDLMGVIYTFESSSSFIAQSDFNGDKLDGTGPSGMTINWTKLNVFEIQIAYLGAGPVKWKVMSPRGDWITVHTLQYPNTQTRPHSSRPTLAFISYATSAAGTTTTIGHASVGLYVENNRWDLMGQMNSFSGSNTITTRESILIVRSRTTLSNLDENRSISILKTISMATDGSKSALIEVFLNPTISGSPVYTAPINFSLLESSDTDDITLSAVSVRLFSFTLAKVDTLTLDLSPYQIQLTPGDVIVITGTSSSSNEIFASLSCMDLI